MNTTSGQEATVTGVELCAFCGESAGHRAIEEQEFAFQDGSQEVILKAKIPVIHCDACDLTFTAEGAEEAQHETVCHYLGRLTPGEIKALRKRLGASQARLAELTKIGIASIKRWESGSHIQNASLDARLRSLDANVGEAARPRAAFKFHFEPRPEAIEASRRFKLRADYGAYAEAA